MTVEPWAQVTFHWGQTHRSLFGDPLVGDRTLWNRAINVGTGISGSSNFTTYRQALDLIVKLDLTGTVVTWRAHNVKKKDLRTDPPSIGIGTKMPLDFSLFSGTTVEVITTSSFKELAKGHIPVVPLPTFYLSICLMFLYIFEVLVLNLSILNPYSSKYITGLGCRTVERLYL